MSSSDAVVPPAALPENGDKKPGKFSLTRRQWSTGFRGIQLALCSSCWNKFRSDTSKIECTEEGSRLIVDVCRKCTSHASRLRFD